MSTNVRYIKLDSWSQSGTLAERVKHELSNYGYSHIFTQNDFDYYRKLHRAKARQMGHKRGGFNPAHAALEICRMWIDDNPMEVSDFGSLEFPKAKNF